MSETGRIAARSRIFDAGSARLAAVATGAGSRRGILPPEEEIVVVVFDEGVVGFGLGGMLSFSQTRSASPKSMFSTRLLASSIVSEPLSADIAARPSAENWPSRASEASSFWAMRPIARACIVSR